MPLPIRRKQNSTKTPLLYKSLLIFFFLNSISLLFYFLHHHHHHHQTLSPSPPPPSSHLKPWPTLPSSLPWSPTPTPHSCEAYFGHGFSDSTSPHPTSFRCHHSPTLLSSVCEAARIRMDPVKIRMSRGGERLEEVIGRGEEEELPRFDDGAFEIEGGRNEEGRKLVEEGFLERYLRKGEVGMHTMRALVGSVRVVRDRHLDCPQWIEEPTLLVTRFEYANVFHTVTDWYSAYVSSRVTNLPGRPGLVFVDGHCKTQLEETWEALFSNIRYAKHFSGPVCFRHAIFSPLGYETAMFKGLSESLSCHGVPAHSLRINADDRKMARISEFGEMIRSAFNLPADDGLISKGISSHNVLFIRREDYLAHPRHDGKVQSRLSNEQEVFDSLKRWASNYSKCKINLVNGLFAHMAMKDQLQAIIEASVVIGAHGAGLTHLVSATANTKVLEIVSSLYRRPHFQLISEWKGLEYHAIYLAGSHADPLTVIEKLSRIMESLGC